MGTGCLTDFRNSGVPVCARRWREPALLRAGSEPAQRRFCWLPLPGPCDADQVELVAGILNFAARYCTTDSACVGSTGSCSRIAYRIGPTGYFEDVALRGGELSASVSS